jgi:anti-sigma regulatory factor (Ser/Thr protein kinase)
VSVDLRTRAFRAERGELAEIRRFVADAAGRHTFSAAVPELQLAVTEACANSIVHSGGTTIRVSVVPVGSCLEITVADDGIYQLEIPNPEADGSGHRGIHLMAAMMDDLALRRGTKERPGTVVRLVKCKP